MRMTAIALTLMLPLWTGCAAENPPATAETQAAADTGMAPPSVESPQEEPSRQAVAETMTQEQLEAAIKAKNPGFAGEVSVGSDGPRIVAVEIHDPAVEDISPLAGLKLQAVDFSGTRVRDIQALAGMPLVAAYFSETGVEDLGPLKGAPLQELNLLRTKVSDLGPLEGAPIRMLWLNDTPVEDILPLRTMPLESLTLAGTKVSDLNPLKGHPLQRLHIARSEVTDLTPLQWMRLARLVFTPGRIKKGIEHARNMASLREIGTAFGEAEWGIADNLMPPAAFWEQYDAGRFD